jgi:hypothetical protein
MVACKGAGAVPVAVLVLVLSCIGPALAARHLNQAPAAEDTGLAPNKTLICYLNGPVNGTLVASEYTEPGSMCLRYQYICHTTADTLCAAGDVGKNKRWAFSYGQKDLCDRLKGLKEQYMDLLCCSTDRCNAPEPALAEAFPIMPGLVPNNVTMAVTG